MMATGAARASRGDVAERVNPPDRTNSAVLRQTLAWWMSLHTLAALAAGALLWHSLPAHLTIPWLAFMLLAAGVYVHRLSSWRRSDPGAAGAVLLVMAATYGLAWIAGLGLAISHLDKWQMVVAVLAVTSLAAITSPLLAASVLASRIYLFTLAAAPALILFVSYSHVASPSATAIALVCGALILTTYSLSAASRYSDPARCAPGADDGACAEGGDRDHRAYPSRSDHARQWHALRHSERERDCARATLQALSEAVITTDTEGRVDYMNPAAEVLTGASLSAAHGKPAVAIVSILGHDAAQPRPDPIGQCLLTERAVAGEQDCVLVRHDGSRIALEYSCSPIRDQDARFAGAALMLRDVREKRDMQNRLSWAATHDPLTGLMNRREFEARLRTLRDEAGIDGISHALCFIDLDYFKTINDTRGHLAGDEFLKGLAEALRGRIRGADVLARLGGDEFAALLYGCPLQQAERIAETLRSAIAEYCQGWTDHNVQLGASIGLVEINDKHKDLTELLAAADLACYAAKNDGRDRVRVFRSSDDMMLRWHNEVRWLQTLQQALATCGFELHCQPIAAASGEPARMCELFLRLRDPGGVVHPPAAFAPAAQSYHLMPAIDFWVVDTVLASLRANEPVLSSMDCICIKLAGQSVSDERFLTELLAVLSDRALPVEKLCFQISETALSASPARVRQFIAALKHRGCRVAIDDCGAGAGLFAHLRHLDVDFLKIDEELIRHLEITSIDYEVVLSLQRIASCMGVKTVAGCVDSEATLRHLRQLGVDYAQGQAIAAVAKLEPRGDCALASRVA